MTAEAIWGTVIGGLTFLFAVAWPKVVKPYLKKRKDEKNEKIEDRKKLNYLVSEMTVDTNGSMKTAVMALKTGQDDLRSEQRVIINRLDDIEENQNLAMNLQGIRFWVSNEAGEWTYVSNELCKFVGRAESELFGKSWTIIVSHEERDRIIAAAKFSSENKAGFDEIFNVRKPDGTHIKVWAVALPRAKRIFGGTIGKMTPMDIPR